MVELSLPSLQELPLAILVWGTVFFGVLGAMKAIRCAYWCNLKESDSSPDHHDPVRAWKCFIESGIYSFISMSCAVGWHHAIY